MQLEPDLWLERGYYVDFDQHGQFRIIGPNNHLYCGLIDIPRHKIAISSVTAPSDDVVEVVGHFTDRRVNLYYPAMDDIRTMRNISGKLTFLETRREIFDRLVPQHVRLLRREGRAALEFSRHYAEHYWYRCTFTFPAGVHVRTIHRPYAGYQLTGRARGVPFTITAQTNDLRERIKVGQFFAQDAQALPFHIFRSGEKRIRAIWTRTQAEIEHLLTWGKTSGDRFGTIFPRDWMESADLGIHDLTPEARSAMYRASLKNVSPSGEGWHEDVVGEYRHEFRLAGRDIFDRHMIDIEPHYLLGLDQLPEDFLLDAPTRQTMQRVARYLLRQARSKPFITFKRLPPESRTDTEEYHVSGNWRDSAWAFKKISPTIAPFDVNAVFYPVALEVLGRFAKKLRVSAPDLPTLTRRWQSVRHAYHFRNRDGSLAYALALVDLKGRGGRRSYRQMLVNHLDESYLYTYGMGTPREIESFCRRLADPAYFATPYGPLLVAANNGMGYTNAEYHGLVIWIKQVAFVVLGLSKHLKIAMTEGWDKSLQRTIKTTILAICEQTLDACHELGAVPELYYVDGKVPRFFPINSSKVQLWSAVGIRRIIRKYLELKTDPAYKRV